MYLCKIDKTIGEMERVEIKSMKLSLIFYKDDEAHYSYCPALDLTGYGDSEHEAQESFKIVLEEYVKYTTENQTLVADLEEHGWKIKGKKLIPPEIAESLQKDNNLYKIFNKHDFVKRSIPVKIPFA